MKKRFVAICAVIFWLMVACATAPVKDINTYSAADPKAKFSGYKTYAWLATAQIVNDTSGKWEPPAFDADSEVKFIIDRELRKRGLMENSSSPDLIIVFALGVDMDAMQLKEDPDTNLETLDNVPGSGLVIVLLDSQTGFAIWAGVAEAEVQENPTPETQKARLDYAVTQLIKDIPK